MSTFENAIDYLIYNEAGDDPNGAFSDEPDDHGGPTRWGITQAEAQRHGFDVRALTREQASGIFKSDYWCFDGVVDQRVATKLLDMAANMGRGTAIRIAQKIVGVTADGVWGPATEAAVNSVGADLLAKLVTACVKRYASIVGADHTQAEFIVDWMDRALKVPQ